MDIVVWLQSESRVVKKKVKLHHADPEELQKARPPEPLGTVGMLTQGNSICSSAPPLEADERVLL